MSSKYRGGSVVKEKQGLFFFSEPRETRWVFESQLAMHANTSNQLNASHYPLLTSAGFYKLYKHRLPLWAFIK